MNQEINQAQGQAEKKKTETFQGSYKLNCDELLQMHHTQN